MKRFTIFTAIFFVALLFFNLHSNAKKRDYHFTSNTEFNNVLNEKLKVDIEELLKLIEHNPELIIQAQREAEKFLNNQIQGSYEKIITSHQSPDSELSVAINPKDSSNMIMSVIRLSQSSLNPMTLPIFYTKNFGEKWEVSDFAMMPPKPNTLVLGGGDPMIVFDANGIAHITWISLFIKLNGQKN